METAASKVSGSASITATPPPGCIFTYFAGRGMGERVRYALAAGGIEYSEVYLRLPGALDDLRATGVLLFNQVPLLEIDGLRISQSWTIVRYLARRAGLVPSDVASEVRADALAEGVRDFYTMSGLIGFGWGDRDASLEKVVASCAKYLPLFERALKSAEASGGPFLLGPKPFWVDFQLLYQLDYTEEVIPGSLAAFPECSAFRSAMRDLPTMRAFYASPHCHGLVTKEYIDEVG